MDETREKLEKLFSTHEGCGIFGVLVEPKLLSIMGIGKIDLNQKAHIILCLKNLAIKLEKELFADFNDTKDSISEGQ